MRITTKDLEGGIRILTLDNPPANAFSPALLKELQAACDAAERDPQVRAVIVTGAGKFFSGGLDLKEVASASQPGVFGSTFGRNDGVFALWTLPKPTLAMVNGHAIAGGGIVCLACDVRIAARGNLKIGLNESAIGLSFPIGAYEIAALALNNQQARRVLLEAELHDPDTARTLGMIDAVVEPADLEHVCIERARLLASYSTVAYAHTKRSLQHDAVQRVLNETDEQQRANRAIWTSPEAQAIVKQQLSRLTKKS
jgi:enoyl-CoA hydratase/carnithine racemase